MASVITAQDVSFEFAAGRELFRGLSFSVSSGVTALVGPNGVGKTTLVRLLAGELEPTRGTIRRRGPVALFPQRLEPEPVPVEDFLGARYRWSLIGETLLEGLDRSAPCTALSGGEWMRVRLACVLGSEFLILDEPTNDLDREGRRAVASFLRGHEGGALLISHDRECLRLCGEVLELSNRGLSRFGGGWQAYEDAREKERTRLNEALERAKREREAAAADRVEQLARQEKRGRQGAQAAKRTGMSRIEIGGRKRRAQATTGKIDSSGAERAQEAVREAHEAYKRVKVDPVMYADLVGYEIPSQKLVAEARGFNVRFGRWVFPRDLDFSWRGNVRVALRGGNGSGKSTLLKAVLGAELVTRGELRRGGLASLYVDQRCASLDDDKTVLENARAVSLASDTELRNGLAKFLFARETVFQKARDLSGGERLRAALARGFLASERPELLVLDEPTNNLDLANIEFLEGLVREFRGALLVVSHDEVFLDACGASEELALG